MTYLAIGEQIVARLKDQVPELIDVFMPADLTNLEDFGQITPACLVAYGGDDVVATAGRGAASMIGQAWDVYLAVGHSGAQLGDTSERQQDAGLLIPKILKALQGWQPAASTVPLVRVKAPQPEYLDTCAYYPFAFTGKLINS